MPVKSDSQSKPDLGTTCFYFGTFNPIHAGHLILAQAALCQFNFERIVFIPAGHPPHRLLDTDMLSAHYRAELVGLAIADNPHFELDALEIDGDGPSYTFDTLQRLKVSGRYGELSGPIPLIIGSDALAKLATWHQPKKLIQQVCFLQARRAGDDFVEAIELPTKDNSIAFERISLNTLLLNAPLLQISSTDIRRSIKEAHNGKTRFTLESLRYSVNESVCQRIIQDGFYR